MMRLGAALAAGPALALLALGVQCAQLPEVRDGRPNFVVILVDDLGFGDVGFQGATEIRTPNIDRIAKEGTVFSNGYVTSPICTPSRGGLLTGRYPARFGLDVNLAYAPFDPHLGLPVEEVTVAKRLQDAGYRTGLVGKWQLGAAPNFLPRERGFGYFFGFLGGGHDYWGENYDAGNPSREYYTPLVDDGAAYQSREGEYLTDVLGDKAAGFIMERPGEPFFLYLAYNAPHLPIQGPPDLMEKYAWVEDETRREYLAMVDSLDQNVGKVLDALEEWGVRDDTVVFFLSDNGGAWEDADYADNGPLRGGKASVYEGGIRVPFAASWPGGWGMGAVYDPMVISLDLPATMLALAGVDVDVGGDGSMDGVNLDPFLRGAAAGEPHKALFWRDWDGYAVRAGDFKLLKRRNASPELFNLGDDIGESRNLIDGDRDRAEGLAGLWNEWNEGNIGGYFPSIAGYENQVAQMLGERIATARGWALRGDGGRINLDLPAAPSGLAAEGGDGFIRLTWDAAADGGDGITGYRYRVKGDGDLDWGQWGDIALPSGGLGEYVVRGLNNGVVYRVQLQGVNAFGNGDAAEVSAAPGLRPSTSSG